MYSLMNLWVCMGVDTNAAGVVVGCTSRLRLAHWAHM